MPNETILLYAYFLCPLTCPGSVGVSAGLFRSVAYPTLHIVEAVDVVPFIFGDRHSSNVELFKMMESYIRYIFIRIQS